MPEAQPWSSPLELELDALLAATSWQDLSHLVATHPFVLERPKGQPHPSLPHILYPFDYGYLEGTCGLDGEPVDLVKGSQEGLGLVGLIATADRVKGDRELKLLVDCHPLEVYAALGFFNLAPELMRGRLRLPGSMAELWARCSPAPPP